MSVLLSVFVSQVFVYFRLDISESFQVRQQLSVCCSHGNVFLTAIVPHKDTKFNFLWSLFRIFAKINNNVVISIYFFILEMVTKKVLIIFLILQYVYCNTPAFENILQKSMDAIESKDFKKNQKLLKDYYFTSIKSEYSSNFTLYVSH